MILTLCYMYATLVQWWKLRALRNKLNGTLNHQNALLLCSGVPISDQKRKRCLENLLFQKDGRIGCTVVPRQKLSLSQWIQFPKDAVYFPIYIRSSGPSSLQTPRVHVLLQAHYETYTSHRAELLELERYGELVAWRLADDFEVVLKTDVDRLTKLLHCFTYADVDINHDLKLIRLETIDVEGYPAKIRYDRKYSRSEQLKYSRAPEQWRQFADVLKRLYSKYSESLHPKITIENGSKPEDRKVLPVSEVKPIKKSAVAATVGEKSSTTAKNTLDIVHHSHKKREHKTKKERPIESSKSVKDTSNKTKPKVKPDIKVEECDKTTVKNVKDKTEMPKPIESNQTKQVASKLSLTKTKPALGATNGTDACSKKAETCARNLHRQNATSSKETSPNRLVRPPNILVYADSALAKENVKTVLRSIINKDKYIVYDLPSDTSSNFWDASTTLVVVCGNVPTQLTPHLLQYLVTGGQLLCLCSDLLYSVLSTFTTAEVREHELVRFSYEKWEQVRMMHHIFCYQASPAKKQFSKDSDQSSNPSSQGSSPIAPRTPSSVDIQHDGKTYTIQVQVLGTEETWQTPSLLSATVKNSSGRAIFSQVHLEVDPTQYQDDESKYSALCDSNSARLEILRHILSSRLDIDCDSVTEDVKFTPAYFLGNHVQKVELLNDGEIVKGGKLAVDGTELVFCGKGEEPGEASGTRLPVLVLSCPTNFSTVSYFETLCTKQIGRLVIYSDVLTSSQHVLGKKLRHGLVVVVRQQTDGIGRSNNKWISPLGCAMFSLQLHVELDSPLGRALPLIQHLIMVAAVSAIKSVSGLEKLDVGLKWPNDLYAYSSVKIGGLVIGSIVEQTMAVVNVGCGINLSNKKPTLCLNDIVEKHNKDNGTKVEPFLHEKFLAAIFNEVEDLLTIVQSGNLAHLTDLYYKYWLHSNAKISVKTKENDVREVRVVGIDEFGFLKVQSPDGEVSSVQPDGNTFDMLEGLIAPKIS